MKKYFRKKEDLYDAVQEVGFLPFFPCEIKGLSIEEHTPEDLWFTDNPGPWEWKGPVLRMGNCVYGKFFNNKAGFISTKWFMILPTGAGMAMTLMQGSMTTWHRMMISISIQHHHSRKSMLSYEAKGLGNYCKGGRKGFDTHITRLQMQCYVIISDFEYRQDKKGK
jgi:hypothetical protein